MLRRILPLFCVVAVFLVPQLCAAAEHQVELDRDHYSVGDPPVVVEIKQGKQVLNPADFDVTPSVGSVMVLPSPMEGAPGRLLWILPDDLDRDTDATLSVTRNGETAVAQLVLRRSGGPAGEPEWSAGAGFLTNFGKVGALHLLVGGRYALSNTTRLDLGLGFYSDGARVDSELSPTDVETARLHNTVVPLRLGFLYEWRVARYRISAGPQAGLVWVSSTAESALTGTQRGSRLSFSMGVFADASTETPWFPGAVFVQTGWSYTPSNFDFAQGNVGGDSGGRRDARNCHHNGSGLRQLARLWALGSGRSESGFRRARGCHE